MKNQVLGLSMFALIMIGAMSVVAQDPDKRLSMQDVYKAETAFEKGNDLMEEKKFAEALEQYRIALEIIPQDPALLFNGGLAAYSGRVYAEAEEYWKRLKGIEPEDWHVRSKLVQAYQALGKLEKRDEERRELFELRKTGKIDALNKQFEYCRDQFEVAGKKVMAFEHFELKGDRALRYVFSILNEAGDGEEFRISLGSYDLTNAIWRETTKPKPKEGERLFHLDGYFDWGHATYGMYFPEPSYDDTRKKVIEILEGRAKAASGTVLPGKKKPEN